MHWTPFLIACEALTFASTAHAAALHESRQQQPRDSRRQLRQLHPRQYSNSTAPLPSPAASSSQSDSSSSLDSLSSASQPGPGSSFATEPISSTQIVSQSAPAVSASPLPAYSGNESDQGTQSLLSASSDTTLSIVVIAPSEDSTASAIASAPSGLYASSENSNDTVFPAIISDSNLNTAGSDATPTTTDVGSQITPAPQLPTAFYGAPTNSWPGWQNNSYGGWNSTNNGNSSCNNACTINAQAGLNWWFPNQLFHDLASIKTLVTNGSTEYSLLQFTTSFDVSAAMQAGFYSYTYSTYFDTEMNMTISDFIQTNMPLPTAAKTVTLTQTDVQKPGPTGTFGAEGLAKLNLESVSRPSFAVPAATGSYATATYSTNVVYYTAYEVAQATPTVDAAGSPSCMRATRTYQMDSPYAYGYDDPTITLGQQVAASGPVLGEFIQGLPQSLCEPGTWLAPTPTMYALVEETYQRGFALFAVHQETSVTDAIVAPTGYIDGQLPTNPLPTTPEAQNQGSSAGSNGDQGSSAGSNGNQGGNAGSNGNQGGGTSISFVRPTAAPTQGTGSNNAGNVNGIGFNGGGNNGGFGNPGPGGSVGFPNYGGQPARPAPVITVAGQTLTPNAATQYYIGPGQTLTPGGTANINGQQVSLTPNAQVVVVNGQSQQVRNPVGIAAPQINVGGVVYSPNSDGSYNIQGQTLTPGRSIVVGGNTVSLGPSGGYLAVNGITITPPAVLPTAAPAIVVGASTYFAQGGPSFLIGGQTLRPGGVITANGNTISLGPGPSPSVVVINGQAQDLSPIYVPPSVNIGGVQYTVSPGASFVIQGQTVRPGEGIVVAGTTVSIPIGARYVVVNGVTSSLAPMTIPAVSVGGSVFPAIAGPAGAYVIGGQTLLEGGAPITVDGNVISLAPGGQALIVNGQTSLLDGGAFPITNPPLLTIGDQTYTANAGTTFVIDGMTLTPGGVIVDKGTTISLAPSATAVVVNGQTTALFPATNMPAPAIASATANMSLPTSVAGAGKGAAKPTTTTKGAAASLSATNTFVFFSITITSAMFLALL